MTDEQRWERNGRAVYRTLQEPVFTLTTASEAVALEACLNALQARLAEAERKLWRVPPPRTGDDSGDQETWREYADALQRELEQLRPFKALAVRHQEYLHLQLKSDPGFKLSNWERAWLRSADALSQAIGGTA